MANTDQIIGIYRRSGIQAIRDSLTDSQLEDAAVAAETWSNRTTYSCAAHWAATGSCGETVW